MWVIQLDVPSDYSGWGSNMGGLRDGKVERSLETNWVTPEILVYNDIDLIQYKYSNIIVSSQHLKCTYSVLGI